MGLTEALLLVIVLVLIWSCMGKEQTDSHKRTYDCVDRASGATTVVQMKYKCSPGCMCPKCRSPEAQAMNENFSATGVNSVDTNESYVNYDSSAGFADSNESYKDFITALSIDPQTLRNHGEFVQDRLNGQNQNITGRTYAISEPVEGNDIPWTGLRRPQLIPEKAMGNPTQMPDVRESNYTYKPTFTWNSSPF